LFTIDFLILQGHNPCQKTGRVDKDLKKIRVQNKYAYGNSGYHYHRRRHQWNLRGLYAGGKEKIFRFV
jgi:hypothetical protein